MKPTAVISIKKLLLLAVSLFFVFCLVSFIFTRSAHAIADCAPATTTVDAINRVNKCAISTSAFDDKIFNFNQMAGTVCSIQRLLTGTCELQPEINKVTAGTGALASAGRAVAMLYSVQPVSGVQYFAGVIQRFNPIQPAYAQGTAANASCPAGSNAGGIGFSSLCPVQNVWSAFRNISYIGFIIVFIITGFMVMFRSKISPQAIATIQDSLPRIVVALILVTFSYAFVGLMIDAMFVILNVVINALGPGGAGLIDIQGANKVISSNVFQVVWGAKGGVFDTVFHSVNNIIEQMFNIDKLNNVLGFLGGGLVAIMAAIAMLFVMFKVFFMLLMSYISIIVLTIFAPFILLFQALPGNNGAKEWFKQVAANISVFPVVALMFILAGMLSGIPSLGGTDTGKFPQENVGQFPLFTGGLGLDNLGPLIGLGILFVTPSTAKLVRERFGLKEGGALGTAGAAAMAGFAAGAGPLRAGAGQAWNKGPIGDYRKLREQRRQEERQRKVELESIKGGKRTTTFYK